ncbi:MAG: hypothetical protein GY909_18555 [Oligoflexia bacterium]|nr:hypothetical protein [Oligoflexia bacterium]
MKKVASRFILNYFSNSDGVFKKIAQMFGSSENAIEELQNMAHGEVKERVSFSELLKFYPSLKHISENFKVEEDHCKLASLSQVYRVIDSEGKSWALKIKLPGIEKEIRSQLKKIGFFGQVEHLSSKMNFGFDKYTEEFERVLNQELDYNLERQNMAFASKIYSDSFIKVPELHPQIQDDNFILMEYCEGKNIETIQNKKIGFQLFKGFYSQLLVNGVFQGDTNPGNFLFREDSIVLLDHGHTIRLSLVESKAVYELLTTNNTTVMIQALVALGFSEQKLSTIVDKVPLIVTTLREPFDSIYAYDIRDWNFKEKINLILGEDRWVFRSSGNPKTFLMIRSFIGLINLLKKSKHPIFFKKVIDDVSLPNSLKTTELPEVSIEAIDPKLLERKLTVLIDKNDQRTTELQVNALNIFNIEEMLNDQILKTIEQQGVSLTEIKRKAIEGSLRPMSLIDVSIDNARYQVKIN